MTTLTMIVTINRADIDGATTAGEIEDALRTPVAVALASLQGSLNAEVKLVGMTITSDTPVRKGALSAPLFMRPQAQ